MSSLTSRPAQRKEGVHQLYIQKVQNITNNGSSLSRRKRKKKKKSPEMQRRSDMLKVMMPMLSDEDVNH